MQEHITTGIGLPSLISRRVAAQQLAVSLRTLDNRLKAGELPHVRLGHLVRFKTEDIVTYIEAHRIPAKSEVTR